MKKIGIMALFLLTILSCNKEKISETCIYQEDEFSIALDSVKDSRCPSNVVCVWEGEAKLFLTVKNGELSENIQMTVRGYGNGNPDERTVFGKDIKLINVFPYPEDDFLDIPIDEYEVDLEVN